MAKFGHQHFIFSHNVFKKLLSVGRKRSALCGEEFCHAFQPQAFTLPDPYISIPGFLDPVTSAQTSKTQHYYADQLSKYPCDICGKGFQKSWLLNRHILIHTGEKPFACNLCEKRFNQKSTLKKHMRVHYRDTLQM